MRSTFVGVLAAVLCLSLGSTGLVRAESGPPIPGTIEGTGTYFEITDSDYLNVTLDSSEPINLYLESLPEMVIMFLESASGAASTEITLAGFAPETTYHQSERDSLVAFTTDATGSYAYTQDLSVPHLLMIEPVYGYGTLQSASIVPPIWVILDDATGGDATQIGDWDWPTKTCTLTDDVHKPIWIDGDYITLDGNGLDGNGYTVSGPDPGTGVLVAGRTGVTIKNLTVRDWGCGVYLDGSSSCTVTGNMFHRNVNTHIRLHMASGNTVANNVLLDASIGIFLGYSDYNQITDNTISNAIPGSKRGIYLWNSSNTTITGGTISSNLYGIQLHGSDNNTIYNINFIDNVTQADVDLGATGNVFNLDPPVGGNYWNDHTTPDIDPLDGFVDSPYLFEGGQDNWPWAAHVGRRAPIAAFSYTAASPTTLYTISFTDHSTDPDGTVVSWAWAFGDSATSSEQNPTHEYAVPGGTYTVTLTVTDNDDETGSVSKQITVPLAYSFLGFLPPVEGRKKAFKQGSTIPIKFRISDGEGNPVPDAVATLVIYYLENGAPDGEAEVHSTAAGDWGTQFRYDAEGDLYIFNLSTKHPSFVGYYTYQAEVTLDDGQTTITAVFSLK